MRAAQQAHAYDHDHEPRDEHTSRPAEKEDASELMIEHACITPSDGAGFHGSSPGCQIRGTLFADVL